MAVQRFAATFFPGTTGQIYRMAESRNRLDRIGGWDDAATVSPPEEIEPDECLALRTGREHEWPQGQPPVPCPHHGDATPVESVCLPLLGRDQSMGLLTIARPDPDETDGVEPINFWLAHRVADQLGLVLANLELHERLRAQSIRDPLTSLFNRRYLDETLAREMERSRRESTPLAVIAMDIDHFKPYNDEYGHEAGDKVLQALAKALMGHVRDSDIACRAGGEEFILVLPTADADLATRRAEELRENVGGMVVAYGNTQLPPVTISAGVAALPPDPGDADGLLRAADRALYQAKRDGRNCVRRAGESG
jgi:diguanylate cyclase (GGDEF)-like protein